MTSSGEPTCSPHDVTKALQVYEKCAKEGVYFPNVNLFTNGILFANDTFCEKWLPIWKSLYHLQLSPSFMKGITGDGINKDFEFYRYAKIALVPGLVGYSAGMIVWLAEHYLVPIIFTFIQ